MLYICELKKKFCENICINHYLTFSTAKEYDIPIKTLEKWITAYNKNPHCYDCFYLTNAILLSLFLHIYCNKKLPYYK